MTHDEFKKFREDFLKRKNEQVKDQLLWLIERGILMVHELPLKVSVNDSDELKFSQRIGLRVETEQFIERLEEELTVLREVEKAARDWFIYVSESGFITDDMTEFGVFETCRLAFEKLDEARRG